MQGRASGVLCAGCFLFTVGNIPWAHLASFFSSAYSILLDTYLFLQWRAVKCHSVQEKKTFFVNVFLCFFSLEPKISHFCFGSNKKSFWKMWMASWDRVAVFFRNSFIAPDGLVYSQTNMSPIIWWIPSKVK